MKTFRLTAVFPIFFFVILPAIATASDPQAPCRESLYQVVWETPSADAHGSVPLGNGEVGLNAWIDPEGNLTFFLSRTDAWDDYGRLVKVGCVKIHVHGIGAANGILSGFRQILDTRTGILSAEYGSADERVRLRLWVDANRDVVVTELESDHHFAPEGEIRFWRTEPAKNLTDAEISDLFWGRPGELRPIYPDTLLSSDELKGLPQVGWFHRNRKTPYFDEIGKTQGLSDAPGRKDPFDGRTFGALMTAADPIRVRDTVLASKRGKSHRFEIAVVTLPNATTGQWQDTAKTVLADAQAIPIDQRRADHSRWWAEFQDRSHVIFTPRVSCAEDATASETPTAVTAFPAESPIVSQAVPSTVSPSAEKTDSLSITAETFLVTRAGILQRYIDACGGRGHYPIKFNGAIFTVPEEGTIAGPDYRRWGPGYWWQNTRFPYLSKPMAGDFDLMRPFLETYWEIFEVCQFRTKRYFGFEGAYFPECLYFWGDVFPETYGTVPWNERADPLQESRWHRWEFVGGLEVARMFLTYAEFTQDNIFLREKAIPLADSVTRFFDEFYRTDPITGKLDMTPSQALETFWDCRNPAPEIAGLTDVLDHLCALSDEFLTPEERARFEMLRKKIPAIPLRSDEEGRPILAPAEVYENHNNREIPELYSVFPFRLFSFDQSNAEMARRTFEVRSETGYSGWCQDDLFAAYLGLSEPLRQNLTRRAATVEARSRFPAFWGPNADWTPDQDHGGVLQTAIQAAVLQTDGRKIWITPALPKEWDVDFKLHAPMRTVIEGRTVGGTIVELRVTPPERRADVTVIDGNK